jgi:hypothetical protein
MDVEVLKTLGIKLTPEQIKALEEYEALNTYREIVGGIAYFNNADKEAATKLVASLAENAETLTVLASKVVGKAWWQVGFTVAGLGKIMVRVTPGDME